MNLSELPSDVRNYMSALIQINAVSSKSLLDKTFINHLSGSKIDPDFIINRIARVHKKLEYKLPAR